jgi:hypothetical protein
MHAPQWSALSEGNKAGRYMGRGLMRRIMKGVNAGVVKMGCKSVEGKVQ